MLLRCRCYNRALDVLRGFQCRGRRCCTALSCVGAGIATGIDGSSLYFGFDNEGIKIIREAQQDIAHMLQA